MTLLSRRGLIKGLASLIVAPAVVKATSIMPVKGFWWEPAGFDFEFERVSVVARDRVLKGEWTLEYQPTIHEYEESIVDEMVKAIAEEAKANEAAELEAFLEEMRRC